MSKLRQLGDIRRDPPRLIVPASSDGVLIAPPGITHGIELPTLVV
jgi:hypothetical protein